MTKKTDGKRRLSIRQSKLLEGVSQGITPMQAALDAGYSQRSAEHAGELLDTLSLREALGKLLASPEKIAQRINEGLDAKETKFFQHEGRVVETRDVTAWSERRMYVELAARLKGLDPGEKVDVMLTPSLGAGERLSQLLAIAARRARAVHDGGGESGGSGVN